MSQKSRRNPLSRHIFDIALQFNDDQGYIHKYEVSLQGECNIISDLDESILDKAMFS